MQGRSLNGLRKRLLKSLAEKQKIKERLLAEYIKRLKREVPKSTILLFGSRAKGNSLPYSDYDIAVILDEVKDKVEMTERLRRLKPRGIDLDLIVFSIDEIEDPLVKKMLEGSRTLHNGLNLRLHDS